MCRQVNAFLACVSKHFPSAAQSILALRPKHFRPATQCISTRTGWHRLEIGRASCRESINEIALFESIFAQKVVTARQKFQKNFWKSFFQKIFWRADNFFTANIGSECAGR